MIISKTISPWRLLKIIWLRLLIMAVIGVAGSVIILQLGYTDWQIGMTAPSILGTALSIFLGFRTSAAMERWDRGRSLWSDLSSASLNLSLILARVDGEPYINANTGKHSEIAAKVMPRMIRRNIAWAWALNRQLKDLAPLQDCEKYLDADEYEALKRFSNPAMKMLYNQSRDFRIAQSEGQFFDGGHFEIVGMLRTLVASQRNCEGLKTTPFPTHYTFFTEVFIWMLVILLSFSLPAVESVGYLSIAAVVLIGWVFSMIEGIGKYMQDPFVNNRNVVPMDALSRMLEIDLLEIALEETDLPPVIDPVDGALS